MGEYKYMAIAIKDISHLQEGDSFNFPILKLFKEGEEYDTFKAEHPECQIRAYDEFGIGTQVK